jgi:hypothetical protein
MIGIAVGGGVAYQLARAMDMASLKNFVPIHVAVDTKAVLGELDAHPELWGKIPYRATLKGTPHAGMQDIWFHYADPRRYAPGDLHAMTYEHIPVWYPSIKAIPSVRKIVFDLMCEVEGETIGLVMATKIKPGFGIDRHIDQGWHCQYHDKFYIPLQADANAIFGCERHGVTEEIETRPGEVWLMDNRHPHWVRNDSARDRLMLIVCIHTDKFNDFHERSN